MDLVVHGDAVDHLLRLLSREARLGLPEPVVQVDVQALARSDELPLAASTVGVLTRVHPSVRLALRVIGATDARDLAAVMAAVGLASNLAALVALVTDGIQKGHMALHARAAAAALEASK